MMQTTVCASSLNISVNYKKPADGEGEVIYEMFLLGRRIGSERRI